MLDVLEVIYTKRIKEIHEESNVIQVFHQNFKLGNLFTTLPYPRLPAPRVGVREGYQHLYPYPYPPLPFNNTLRVAPTPVIL